MLLLEIGLGLGSWNQIRGLVVRVSNIVIQGHLENRFKKSRDSRV